MFDLFMVVLVATVQLPIGITEFPPRFFLVSASSYRLVFLRAIR
jgi:hypothetical protein